MKSKSVEDRIVNKMFLTAIATSTAPVYSALFSITFLMHKKRWWKDQNQLVEGSLGQDKLGEHTNGGQMNRGGQGIARTDE